MTSDLEAFLPNPSTIVYHRVSARFRCKTCIREFTLKQDEPFLKYLKRGTQVPMKCPHCGTDRVSEFLERIER